VLLRFPQTLDETELVLRLIENCHMTAQPGYFFDMTKNGYLAVSLLPRPDEFLRNIAVLLDLIDRMTLSTD
jgi:aspartate/methionine/tyrosine aminotransferase